MTISLTPFITQLATLQEGAVPNSKAYDRFIVQTQEKLYWTNLLQSVDYEPIASFQRRADITVQSSLRTALFTETSQNGYYEYELIDLIPSILEYFIKRPSMTLQANDDSNAMTFLVPRSLSVSSNGIVPIGEGQQTAIGSFFTFTFSINIDGD